LISKVADGEASPEEMRDVRPHLKGCLACKATLREYRATPARIAGLVPPVVALAGGGGKATGLLGRLIERFGGMGDAAGAKVAAVAAAGVVLAGGGAAGIDALHHDPPRVAPSAYEQTVSQPASAPATNARSASSAPVTSAPDPSTAAMQAAATAGAQNTADPSPKATADPKPATDPKPEFDPGTSSSDSSASDPKPTEFASNEFGAPATGTSGSGTSGSGSAAGEFAP
jgi:hypothetical protein